MAVLVAASALMRPGCPCDGPLASADLLGLLHLAALAASRRAAKLLRRAGDELRLSESGSLTELCLQLVRHAGVE